MAARWESELLEWSLLTSDSSCEQQGGGEGETSTSENLDGWMLLDRACIDDAKIPYYITNTSIKRSVAARLIQRSLSTDSEKRVRTYRLIQINESTDSEEGGE